MCVVHFQDGFILSTLAKKNTTKYVWTIYVYGRQKKRENKLSSMPIQLRQCCIALKRAHSAHTHINFVVVVFRYDGAQWHLSQQQQQKKNTHYVYNDRIIMSHHVRQ